jgi:type VI secretion system protein ImpG
MNPKFLNYYNEELQFIREFGNEFAQAYPKIARRLSLDGLECADPYVERLLEGFSFLSARVRMKLDAEFPRFTQQLLRMAYPSYECPTPSMAIVALEPDMSEGGLAEGYTIPSGSRMRGSIREGQQTACDYRTCQDVTLWPIQVTAAEYATHARDLGLFELKGKDSISAGLTLTLQLPDGMKFSELPIKQLPFYIVGHDDKPRSIYKEVLAHKVGVVVKGDDGRTQAVGQSAVESYGLDDDQAILPYGNRTFHGYRLLHEYFAFPQRFLFFELRELDTLFSGCHGSKVQLHILLDNSRPDLLGAVTAGDFRLYCAPVVNLFEKTLDRIQLDTRDHEYHVVPDRSRPIDFEVYECTEIIGMGTRADDRQEFQPLYAFGNRSYGKDSPGFYTLRRESRRLSSKIRRDGHRSNYLGTEVFLSLVDPHEAPYNNEMRQLSIKALCTNRDLPHFLPTGTAGSDFSLQMGAPVKSIRCVAGPTMPKAPIPVGESAWRLITHLSLNYVSLEGKTEGGVPAICDLLKLYADIADPGTVQQIDGIRDVTAKPVFRRIPVEGLPGYGRGYEITLEVDEHYFQGWSAMALGTVLERFFAKYVSINSFTQTVMRTQAGKEIRWPVRAGARLSL